MMFKKINYQSLKMKKITFFRNLINLENIEYHHKNHKKMKKYKIINLKFIIKKYNKIQKY